MTTKECSHCGEAFAEENLPRVQSLDDVLHTSRNAEDDTAALLAEEERNLRWAQRDQAKQPVKTIIVEEIEERFVWISIPFLPSLFSGFYTEALFFNNWISSLVLGIASGFAYLFMIMISTDMIFRRVTGYFSILTHWCAWAWFYYWTYERGSILAAFIGPWFFIATFGRLMYMWDFLKHRRK